MDIVNWVKTISDDFDIQESNIKVIQDLIDRGEIEEKSIIRNSKGNIVTIRGIVVVDSTVRPKRKRPPTKITNPLLNDYFVSRTIA